jgi:hypothetical protein
VATGDLQILIDQIQELPDVGGIAGNLIEPEQGRVYQNAHDIYEESGRLVREVNAKSKEISMVAGSPFVKFDFIPNAAIFRRECLEEYCWDPEYVIEKEHIDFYLGHKRETDWEFGVCPTVNFLHYPGGDENYITNRKSEKKRTESTQYFLEKWGFSSIESRQNYWFDTHSEITLQEKISRVSSQKSNKEIAFEAARKLPNLIRRVF